MKRRGVLLRGIVLLLGFVLPAAAIDFTMEPAGPLPDDVPAVIRELVKSDGVSVKDAAGKIIGVYWARTEAFEGDPPSAMGVRLETVPEGALMGVAQYPEGGSDFRQQSIPAGFYTIRYALHPEDGNHMGVASSRDFAVLTPVANDTEPGANPSFAELVQLAKTVGNPHPTALRVEWSEGNEAPNLWENEAGHALLDLRIVEELGGIGVQGHSAE